MKKMLSSIPLLFLLFNASIETRGEDFCVDSATEIQNALTTAEANSVDDTVQIVKGTYYGTFSFHSTMGNRITVQGGYEKVNSECQFPSPPPPPSETILDGASSGRVLKVEEYSGGNIVVEGLTIRNGDTIAYGMVEGDGGGLSVLAHNYSGNAGDVTISNNIIEENKAYRFGGVYADSYSTEDASGAVTLTDNIIRNNLATTDTGGAQVRSQTGTFTYAGQSGDITIFNNIIMDNTAANGNSGGLKVYSQGGSGTGTVMVSSNIITGNSSSSYSGGACIYSHPYSGPFGNVVLTNNIITDNESSDVVGGLYIWSKGNYDAEVLGPGSVTFTHNTLSGNSAPVSALGGGLRLEGPPNSGILNVYNNVIWGNTAPTGGDIFLTGFQITNGCNNDYSVMSGSWDSESDNINQNPYFTGGGDYHLKPNSLCVDAGTAGAPALPATDIDGEDRIKGRAPDMGAYEMEPDFYWPMFMPAITGKHK